MGNPYNEDDTLNWLASQFAEGLVSPSDDAENAYNEIKLLRDVLEAARVVADETGEHGHLAEAIESYDQWNQ